MAYIPKEHEKYNLLPKSRDNWEVISYDQELLDKVNVLTYSILGETVEPNREKSLLEYIKKLEEYKSLFSDNKDTDIFNRYIADIIKRNDKRNWSVVRYIGDSIFPMSTFTIGRAYYWPVRDSEAAFGGIVDDDEITAYDVYINKEDWEILCDPTGMARNILGHMDEGN